MWATQEAEVRRIDGRSQPQANRSGDHISKTPINKSAGGVS